MGFENVGSATGASTRNFSAEKYPCSQNLIMFSFRNSKIVYNVLV